jgi:uncharacterized protein YdeI (YjbR/CyaY-like superfamily)
MDKETFCPKSRKEWRNWLIKNHETQQSVWLIYFKISTKKASIRWSDAVDEALCFGWIDSTKKTIDKESYQQYFSKRKPNSIWSKINKDKIDVLIQNNQMTNAGLHSIEIAKQNGSWTLMDDVEKLIIPTDLKKALESNPISQEFFMSLSNSKRKEMLAWIVLAKREETRQKRIKEIVDCAGKNSKPKHFA